MNKELAKTLTIALVSYLDENRPEGTMDCSSAECEAIEQAFIADNFFYVETLVQRKLSRLTEFEQEVSDIVEYCKEHGENVAFDYAKRHAKALFALAKKELLKDDELTKKHLDGYCMGREDTLREMMDFVESQFHGKKAKEFDTPTINIPTWEPPCYRGGPCTNPQKDCINCPRSNVVISPNTASGTSTLKEKE